MRRAEAQILRGIRLLQCANRCIQPIPAHDFLESDTLPGLFPETLIHTTWEGSCAERKVLGIAMNMEKL